MLTVGKKLSRSFIPFLLGSVYLACSPTLEDSIEKLSGSPDERKIAKHELLLAKEHAVEPLLEALENPRYRDSRPDLVDVLVSLFLRVEREQISNVLRQHLLDDPDPRVRGRIAYKLGMNMKLEFADSFISALEDSSSEVRQHALAALGNVFSKLEDHQHEILRPAAMQNLADPIEGVSDAALFLVEEYIGRWAEEARQQALKANVNEADSILARALVYAPESKQLHYYRGVFYFENDQRERGLQILRENQLLFDVPAFDRAPVIDGRLEESVWKGAAVIDTFYRWGRSRTNMLPQAQTRAHLGYTAEAFFMGIHCFDAHPESLVVVRLEDTNYGNQFQDLIEFLFDRNLDQRTLSGFKINTVADIRDGWQEETRDLSWNAEKEVATFVGADYWSLEFKLKWDPTYHPPPTRGDISGFNIQRCFRGKEYSQAFRDYDEHNDTPGYLTFK